MYYGINYWLSVYMMLLMSVINTQFFRFQLWCVICNIDSGMVAVSYCTCADFEPVSHSNNKMLRGHIAVVFNCTNI